jgi:hypothetical protein
MMLHAGCDDTDLDTLSKKGANRPPSFVNSAKAMGVFEMIHVFGSLYRILDEFAEEEMQEHLSHGLLHLSGDVTSTSTAHTRILSVVSPARSALVDVVVTDSNSDSAALSLSADLNMAHSHVLEILVTSAESTGTASLQGIQVAAQIMVADFFHKDRMQAWLPYFVEAFDGDDAIMLSVIRAEFPHFVQDISPIIAVDEISILSDAGSNILGGPQLIDIHVPLRMDNFESAGYQKVKHILKYALGPLSVEVLDSYGAGANHHRLLGMEWDPWKYEFIIRAAKFRNQLLFHPVTGFKNFIRDVAEKYLGFIDTKGSNILSNELTDEFMNAVLPSVDNFVPHSIVVGASFILKFSIAFKALGVCTVCPCTVYFKIVVTSTDDCEVSLVDVGGAALSVVRFFMPSALRQIVNSCKGTVRLNNLRSLDDCTDISSSPVTCALDGSPTAATARSPVAFGCGNVAEEVLYPVLLLSINNTFFAGTT